MPGQRNRIGQVAAQAQAANPAPTEPFRWFGMPSALEQLVATHERQQAALQRGDYRGALNAALESPLAGSIGPADLAGVFGAMVKAYHGSPHLFAAEPGHPMGRFRADKIGTGEGAQSYAYGHYLAENPKVARAYRTTLTELNPRIRLSTGDYIGSELHSMGSGSASQIVIEKISAAARARYKGSLPKAAREVLGDLLREQEQMTALARGRKPLPPPPGMPSYFDQLRDKIAIAQKIAADPNPQFADPGAVYHAHIDVNHSDLLDWDKPLSQQSQKVKKALAKLQADASSQLAARYEADKAAGWGELSNPAQVQNWNTGADAYRGLTDALGSAQAASAALRDAGIPGVRYLDAGSRFMPANLPDNPIANEARRFLEQSGGDPQKALLAFNASNPISRFATTERDQVRKVIEAAGKQETRNIVMFPGTEHLISIKEKK